MSTKLGIKNLWMKATIFLKKEPRDLFQRATAAKQ